MPKGKISIIGAGFVGATSAFALMHSSSVKEIVIVDINKEKALGEALDLSHGIPFMKPVKVSSGEYSDCAGSDIVVITAGANQKPDETRRELLGRNIAVLKSVIDGLKPHITTDTIILMVTNPVDVLTYMAVKLSGFPKNKVFGTGTVLDSSRFCAALSECAGVDARNIDAYIIGEHGDSEVPVWSTANIAGLPGESFCKRCGRCSGGFDKERIFNDVKNSAYSVIDKKGATYYAVALAVKRIVECVLRNEKSVLTVSSVINGKYGLQDVAISVPTVVGENGIEDVLELNLADEEMTLLRHSADIIKRGINEQL